MKRRKPPLRRLTFFAPTILLAAVVLYALLGGVPTSGTLEVRAETSGSYYASFYLFPVATVGNTAMRAPFNLTLAQGTYNVIFAPVNGFVTPSGKTVTVLPGKVAYAIGVYQPVVRAVQMTASGFNATSVSALHGVTPVVWVNHGANYLVLELDSVGPVVVYPNANYTHVFSASGTFAYSIFDTNYAGYVTVS